MQVNVVALMCMCNTHVRRQSNTLKFETVSSTKILCHENISHEIFLTRKFPDLRYIIIHEDVVDE